MIQLKSTQFKKELKKHFSKYKNIDLSSYWCEDTLIKINNKNNLYHNWLSIVIPYLKKRYNLSSSRILDVGSGFGVHSMQLALLNNDVLGIDVSMDHLRLANILKSENTSGCLFLQYDGKKIPLKDKSVDIVTMFTCLEHIDDQTLNLIMSELHRVCKGVIYILVPNKLSIYDAHVKLYFLPFMPRKLALFYILLRGKGHVYEFSYRKEWDVYYRTYFRIKAIFEPFFESQDLPVEFSFPPEHLTSKTRRINSFLVKHFHINRNIFEPYINLILVPKHKTNSKVSK